MTGVVDVGEVLDGDAAVGSCILLTDNAVQLFLYVVHKDGVEGVAGVDAAFGSCECIVGVAACCGEVVGCNGIGCVGIEGLAVNLVDGDAVDGLGAVVGGAGVGLFVCVILSRGVNGDLHACDLGEAADCAGSAVGGSLKSLKKVGALDVNDGHGVAEGQNGKYVVLGDVALVDPCTDAAAVGYRNNVLCGNRKAVGVLKDLPHHGVGDEVAEIGLQVAVAGCSVAVELDFALCEDFAVLGFNAVNDDLCRCCNGLVLCGLLGHCNELVAFDGLGCVVDNDNADVLKLGAGGLDGFAGRTLLHDGVRVTVDDEVDALDLCEEVDGTVGFGFAVNAEVCEANDDVCAGILESCYLCCCALIHLLTAEELESLDESGVCLGLGLGSLKAEEADLHAVDFLDSGCIKDALAVCAENVCAEDLELSLAHIALELLIAVVKFVVAEGCKVVACDVHHLDGVKTLGAADIGGTLAVVAGINEDDGCALCFVLSLESCDVSIAFDRTVNVIAVENDGLAIKGLGLLCLNSACNAHLIDVECACVSAGATCGFRMCALGLHEAEVEGLLICCSCGECDGGGCRTVDGVLCGCVYGGVNSDPSLIVEGVCPLVSERHTGIAAENGLELKVLVSLGAEREGHIRKLGAFGIVIASVPRSSGKIAVVCAQLELVI